MTVAGPYIVYMLKDVDVIEDWTAIKKVSDSAVPYKLACLYVEQRNYLSGLLV